MFQIHPVVLDFLKSPDFLMVYYPMKVFICVLLLYVTIKHLGEILASHYRVIELSSHAKITRNDTPTLHVGFIIYLGYILITSIISWIDFYQGL